MNYNIVNIEKEKNKKINNGHLLLRHRSRHIRIRDRTVLRHQSMIRIWDKS